MERSDEPIYARVYTGINDDIDTPEGRTYVRLESAVGSVLLIFYIIGHFFL